MDSTLLDLAGKIVGPAGQIARDLVRGGVGSLTPQQLRIFIVILLTEGGQREAITRFLVMLARSGLVEAEVVMSSIAEAAEIAAAAEAEAAAAAGAEAGAGAALTAAAALTMVLSLLFMLWSIVTEYRTDLMTHGGFGRACALDTADGQRMARLYRSITVTGWGSRSTLNKALARAQEMCARDSHLCLGECGDGSSCAPSMAVVSQEMRVPFAWLWTEWTIGFTCPCVCS